MTQDHWKDVRSKVEGLGLKLKLHLEQEADDADDADDTGEPRAGSTREAIEDLGDRLEDAFEAFGNAAKDPSVRADVKEIGGLLKDALRETLSTVGAEVGGSLRKAGDRARNSAASRHTDDDGDHGSAASDTPFKDSADDTVQDTVRDTGTDPGQPEQA